MIEPPEFLAEQFIQADGSNLQVGAFDGLMRLYRGRRVGARTHAQQPALAVEPEDAWVQAPTLLAAEP